MFSLKSALAAVAGAAMLVVGLTSAKAEDKPAVTANPFEAMFNSAAWNTGGEMKPGTVVAFNPVDPANWAKFADPKLHNKMHMAFTNPAQYAQFMQPRFFMQLMNPNSWMKMANPASYATFMNPKVWAYWMQPGAYMHMMNPASYMQGANPAAYAPYMQPNFYMNWMNPAAFAVPAGTATGKGAAFNFFDPSAWSKAFQPQAKGTGDKPRS